MINQSRRTLLKGMGYSVAALATGGAASTVMAASKTVASKAAINPPIQSVLPTCDITIYLQQSVGKELVSLMNLTDQVVTLDSIKPVALEHINGSLVVKLNNIAEGNVVMQPGERLAFEVEAISQGTDDTLGIPNVLAGYVNITSDHPAFNGKIPVTVFDSQVA
ncbi:MAG: hypothetical protein ACPG47_00310 [Leucothrix sp.]